MKLKTLIVYVIRQIFLLLLIIFAVLQQQAHSQIPLSYSPVLLCLSAHPDDEDGATLAYYRKLKGIRTYSIFFTRGEGGQNETGPELGKELGVLRTAETDKASKILGSEIYFLGFPDFGYSKTAAETFSIWGGEDSVLSRLVYIIRLLQPDVIITNHDTITSKPGRQHGNHQVVGITAFETFEKAADPSFHPEQFSHGVSAWQAKKLFFRVYRNDSAFSKNSIVHIDIRRRETSGKTIAEIAVEGLNQHRSQGMEKRTVASMSESFQNHRLALVRSEDHYPYDENDLFSGIQPEAKRMGAVDSSFISYIPSPSLPSSDDMIGTSGRLRFTFSHESVIGLVNTYDNTLEQFLQSYNIPYRLLDSNRIRNDDLKSYTTILLDIRTYAYRPDIVSGNNKLLDYVRNGGNIICFYHKPEDWNGKQYSPYPIFLTSERVTEETAPIRLLIPSHGFFTSPNIIFSHDWNGWIQERSIYLPSDDTLKTSAQYQRLLDMSDTDEQEPPTSLLTAQYGKGTYTYVSLALYRQIRIMNDSAVKLFLNLMSQPKK